ncbi:MAG: hypothetical protein AAFR38_12040 [Planctomycetota bacterium]
MANDTRVETPTDAGPRPGRLSYGRSRLLLGISGVGFWVVLSVLVLVLGLPDRLDTSRTGGLGSILLMAAAVVLLQTPFDLLGGLILPKQHGRLSASSGRVLTGWLRGVIGYFVLYGSIGVIMMLAGRAAGWIGPVLVGVSACILLLACRTLIARVLGGLKAVEQTDLGRDVRVLSSSDMGFTGGIAGLIRPTRILVPERWIARLDPRLFDLAIRRRRAAAESGLWERGRLVAVGFTVAGLVLAGGVARDNSGTAGGVLEFASVFTLWSFVGLLVLPTLSRAASHEVDRRIVENGAEPSDLRSLASALDAMQDDEPARPGMIEAIFHPIPSVSSRDRGPRPCSLAAWNAARTSAYLGLAGLSPLGRAVHCNSGRPALWVYLPSD